MNSANNVPPGRSRREENKKTDSLDLVSTSEKLESSLSKAGNFFDKVVSRRETLIKETRDVISLCSKSIVCMHSQDYSQAKELQDSAKRKLAELRKIAGADLVRYIMTPEQEFVESSFLYFLANAKSVPTLSQLGVLPSSYLLGIADVIGELKRNVYDLVRNGNVKQASDMFSAMESLFLHVSRFAVYDHIVPGLRRKLDVARMLIEDVRAVMTEESRRAEFILSIDKLAESLSIQSKLPEIIGRPGLCKPVTAISSLDGRNGAFKEDAENSSNHKDGRTQKSDDYSPFHSALNEDITGEQDDPQEE